MRPAFFPFAGAATAILAVNSLLLYLRVWPAGHLIIPVAALVLLAVAVVLGCGLPSYHCRRLGLSEVAHRAKAANSCMHGAWP